MTIVVSPKINVELVKTLATVLKTTEANAVPRAMRMKLTPVCGRCMGSGHYSFNQIDGTRCYGCSGNGCKNPANNAQMKSTIANAEEAAANGKLESFIEYQKALLLTKNADDKFSKARKNSKVAFAMNPISHMINSPNIDIVRSYNKPMSDLSYKISKLSGDLPYIKDSAERQIKTVEFLKIYEDGLAEIARLDAEFTAKYSDEWIADVMKEAEDLIAAFKAKMRADREAYEAKRKAEQEADDAARKAAREAYYAKL